MPVNAVAGQRLAVGAERDRVDGLDPAGQRLAEPLRMSRSAMSHKWMVASSLPVASMWPSGLNATENACPMPGLRGLPSGVGHVGSAAMFRLHSTGRRG